MQATDSLGSSSCFSPLLTGEIGATCVTRSAVGSSCTVRFSPLLIGEIGATRYACEVCSHALLVSVPSSSGRWVQHARTLQYETVASWCSFSPLLIGEIGATRSPTEKC